MMVRLNLYYVILLLCVAMPVLAVEVISVDINNYGNDVVYSGEAAVPGATEWVAFYGGWAEPAGSPRSANLVPAGTIQPSTYAEQVWLADAGGHDYVTGPGNGLLDDGFMSSTASDIATLSDPNLAFVGLDMFGDAGDLAYGGVFDVYIYGNSAGTFSLTDISGEVIAGPASVTGSTSSDFVEGENYVFFEDVSIADPYSVLLLYSNELNAVQLVGTKNTPVVLDPQSSDPNDFKVIASQWDVAYDTNARDDEDSYGFGSYYGPDTFGNQVGILYDNDYMEYDILIDENSQGSYNLTIDMDTTNGEATLNLYLDGNPIGTLTGDGGGPETVGPLPIKLFTGTHTIRWQSTGYYGANIGDMIFYFAGEISLDTCADVYTYGLEPSGDLNSDCRVNMEDLALLMSEWLTDYNPF